MHRVAFPFWVIVHDADNAYATVGGRNYVAGFHRHEAGRDFMAGKDGWRFQLIAHSSLPILRAGMKRQGCDGLCYEPSADGGKLIPLADLETWS